MRTKTVFLSFFAGAVLVTSQLGFAHENHPAHIPNMEDVVSFRNYLMENVGANTKELKSKIEAGDLSAARVNAVAIAIHGAHAGRLFKTEGNLESSRAKATIWNNWDEFSASLEALIEHADGVAVAAQASDAELVAVHAKKLFGTCKNCHDKFRKPKND